jgi:hypothetical protein
VPLALQRLADLRADRGGVLRERQELHPPPFGAQQRGEPLGLCLFSALIQALEGQHVSLHQRSAPALTIHEAGIQLSRASMSSNV